MMTQHHTPARIRPDQLFQRCPLGCDSDLQVSAIAVTEGPLLRCSSCGQLVSSCAHEQYESALRRWNTAHGTLPDSRSASRYQEVTQRRLRSALRQSEGPGIPPHLLDVGCSSGALLAVAANLGFSVTGVEPASKAAQTAQGAGFNVFHGLLHEAHFPDMEFDIVTLFELIEHIVDPVALLTECHRILKPGGVIVVNTPNADSWTARFMQERWEGFSLVTMGGHISFFSPESMRALARASGLAVASIETRNVRFYEKGQCHPVGFHMAKLAAQLLALPARLAGRGHDLLVFLRREQSVSSRV